MATYPSQPIVSLTPFMGNKPWIKARVVDKSDVYNWNKPNSTGKLFSCTLVDETSSIRMTFFNDAVDKYFGSITNGSVYYISGFQTKSANRTRTSVANDYELSADRDVQVVPAGGQTSNIPTQRYNFVPIHVLSTKEKNSVVDILAVVKSIGEISTIMQKATGKSLTKRNITIVDTTAAVEVTLWEDECARFNYPVGTLLAMKNLRVSTFDGVTLSASKESTFDASIGSNADGGKLVAWWNATQGSTVSTLSVRQQQEERSHWRGKLTLAAIEKMNLGKAADGLPDVFECVVTPTFIRTNNIWYDACPTCNRKVAEGSGKCEKCDRSVVPIPRYLCSLQVSDNVSVVWVTLFTEAAEVFWGKTASALKALGTTDPNAITTIASSRLHVPMLMSFRVKEDTYRSENAMGDMGMGGAQQDRVRVVAGRITDIMSGNDALLKETHHLLDFASFYLAKPE